MKSKKLAGRKLWSAVPMLLLMAVIFSFSAKTAAESSKSSNVFVEVLMDERLPWVEPDNPVRQESMRETLSFLVRKCAHMTEYAVLAMLALYWLFSFSIPYGIRCGLAVVICACYAASDEYHQTFVPGRSGELRDVLVDTAGALLGILFVTLLGIIIKRWKKRPKAQSVDMPQKKEDGV
ncbi:MAG: VanZ family protein [Lachnospiraceae bacterium]|nr:VanZ family protein [Lachnospiraceae bacterium]